MESSRLIESPCITYPFIRLDAHVGTAMTTFEGSCYVGELKTFSNLAKGVSPRGGVNGTKRRD